MLRNAIRLIVASVLALACLPAAAQTNDAESVTAEGQVVFHPKVTALRFQLLLQQHGDNMEATLKKLEATALAEAAGHRLGPLQGLSTYASRFGGSSTYPAPPSSFSATAEPAAADDSDSLEATGSDPSSLEYRVIMNAAYRLQPEK